MTDVDKSRDELLDELDELRRHVAALEADLPEPRVRALRLSREPSAAQVEFIAEFGAIEGAAVDISAGGLCLDVAERPLFRLTIERDGEHQKRHARLVWIQPHAGRGCRLGFEFVERT